MSPSPWLCLEAIPGLVALEADWQSLAGEKFPALRSLCLEPSSLLALSIRCPYGCGCNHRIIHRHDQAAAIAVCCCEPPSCSDIPVTIEEITPLELSRARLGRALCTAFGLASKLVDLPSPNTFQFGSWSTDAVPAILTIQVQNAVFRRVVAELGARLRNPFILFAPTSDFLDAPSKEILENFGAGFFAIDSHVTLTDYGTLQPTTPPGELFARFTPQPKELEEDVARRVFALVDALDSECALKKPTILTVFRLYCVQEKSTASIAHDSHCSKATVISRLNLIRQKTGVDPAQLRRLSSHLNKIEADLSDSRASHIHRQRLIDDAEGP